MKHGMLACLVAVLVPLLAGCGGTKQPSAQHQQEMRQYMDQTGTGANAPGARSSRRGGGYPGPGGYPGRGGYPGPGGYPGQGGYPGR